MNERDNGVNRRDFFKTAGAGLTAATIMMTSREAALAQAQAEKNRLDRIAACSYPIRYIFKNRAGGGRGAGAGAGRGAGPGQPAAGPDQPPARGAQPAANASHPTPPAAQQLPPRSPVNGGWTTAQMKEKYGEITMLDFPQWMKEHFPGVTRMDLFSGLFGDVADDTMFMTAAEGGGGGAGFNPASPSGRKWLDQLAGVLVKTGTKVQHISNNAPFGLADYGSAEADARRKAGVAMAKRWLEGCAVLGVKSMRMNSPSALGPEIRPNATANGGDGYPRNLEIVALMNAAIESYKEMADFGGNLGIKVTFENHWGLAADPMNLRIIIDTINHPYCDATPDFCNWEHDYMLFNGLKALAPYSSSNVHAKYWDRWGDKNDVQRSVRVMLAGGFKGTFALEYEAGPLNGVEGAKYLHKEVLAALTSPTPVI
jgi:sugar phosphate isomerase/epimerase